MRIETPIVTVFLAGLLTACVETAPTAEHVEAGAVATGAESAPAEVIEADEQALGTVGAYRVQSTLIVDAGALLPPTADHAVQTLEGLRDQPSATLFALADDAGVPAVATIRDALPSVLASRLDGWIDSYVRGVTTGDGTVAQVIDTVVGVCRAPIGAVELESRLTVGAGATSRHRLETVGLEVAGQAMSFDVAPLAGVGAALDVSVAATVTLDGDRATLALGDHGFGLPYGRLAWAAFDGAVRARYGRDLRGLLGDTVGCDALAASVANRCVLGVCVGHRSDLRAICEGALDRAVAQLRERVEAQAVEPIALDAGAAVMVRGAATDGFAGAIEGGVWTAQLDLGQGARPAAATFTGARE